MAERAYYFFHPESKCPEAQDELRVVRIVVTDALPAEIPGEWLENYIKRTGRIFKCSNCEVELKTPESMLYSSNVRAEDIELI